MPPSVIARSSLRLLVALAALSLAASASRAGMFDLRGPSMEPSGRLDQNAAELDGTSWQLVRFKGGDDRILTPIDRSRYTLEFRAGGQLSVRIDCNRGRGTWRVIEAQAIEFGALALTRAACPGELNDLLAKQWTSIRSYVIRDGHLHLALMADGGIYEFEPVARAELH